MSITTSKLWHEIKWWKISYIACDCTALAGVATIIVAGLCVLCYLILGEHLLTTIIAYICVGLAFLAVCAFYLDDWTTKQHLAQREMSLNRY